MNKLILTVAKLLPESLLVKFVRHYVDTQIEKHANLTVSGLENLDCDFERPYLFVGNHLSNADGLVLNKVLADENPTFVAGKKLESNSLTNLGFKIVKTIPISPNSPDKEALKKIVGAVKNGNSIFLFPEGTRSRTAKMAEAKKGVLLFARLTGAPIVPVGIWGTETFMPINEDMGSEAFFDAHVHVRIGEVFALPPKAEDETKADWEDNCLHRIMTGIAELLPEEYRGFYGGK